MSASNITTTIINENANALAHALTATVGRKLLRVLLGDQYSTVEGASLAASVSVIADHADNKSMHGQYLRLISKSLCVGITNDLIDRGAKVITPNGDIQDAGTNKEAMNEIESAFNNLKADFENVTVDRFSTQQERAVVGTVAEEKATPEQAKVIKQGDGEKNPVHVPAGHEICEMCHMPGKKTKGITLKLKNPELMPEEVKKLDGKFLCAKCLGKVNSIIADTIKKEEARQAEERAKIAEEEARREQEKKDMESLVALRNQEADITAKIESIEKAQSMLTEDLKTSLDGRLNDLRTSLGGVRTLITNLENKMTGTIALPAPKEIHTVAKPVAQAEVRMTRAQRRTAAKIAKRNAK